MNKAVELSQYKVMYERLKISIDSKSVEIKRLRRVINNYENKNMNTTQRKMLERIQKMMKPKI